MVAGNVSSPASTDGNTIIHRVKASLFDVMGNFLNCGYFHDYCKWQYYPSDSYGLSTHRLQMTGTLGVKNERTRHCGEWYLRQSWENKHPFKHPLDPEVITHILPPNDVCSALFEDAHVGLTIMAITDITRGHYVHSSVWLTLMAAQICQSRAKTVIFCYTVFAIVVILFCFVFRNKWI